MTANRDPGALTDQKGLEIIVRQHGTTTAMELYGEWDLAGLPSIRQAISTLMDGAPKCVVLDLSRLAFIDSSGVHATLELTKRSAAQNMRLVILPGPERVQRIFEITGLLDRLPFIDQGSRVARPNATQSRAAGSNAFPPPTSGAARPHQAQGAAPSSLLAPLLAPPRPRSYPAPSATRRHRPGGRSRP
ncbi:MAG TPA: STAS domain-containing protein [Solirubrobacteraceae bacterium]|nr:STAS domain-containing protein [Solirubrobacteraceae bacterium]